MKLQRFRVCALVCSSALLTLSGAHPMMAHSTARSVAGTSVEVRGVSTAHVRNTAKAKSGHDSALDVVKLLGRKLSRLRNRGVNGVPLLRAINDSSTTDEILYFVKPDGTLWWQADTITIRPNTKSSTYTEYYSHKLGTPVQVGEGWDTPLDVLPGGGSTIYVERNNGNLDWFLHEGYETGKAEWKGAITVGTGWTSATNLIPMGDGVIYTILPNGDLRWNKHNAYKNGQGGYGGWVQPGVDVMPGIKKYKKVFGGGNGVFYAITNDGKLIWLRHVAYLKPIAAVGKGNGAVHAAQVLAWARTWKGPVEIGSAGWGDFTKIFSTGNGHIYAVTPEGNLNFYDFTGWQTGEIKWGVGDAYPNPQISQGWKDYLFVFGAMPGNVAGS